MKVYFVSCQFNPYCNHLLMRPAKPFSLLLLLCTFLVCPAQEDKQDYIWLFGYDPNIPQDTLGGSMLDFHFQPRAITYFELPHEFNFWPVSTISNKSGELVLYTNGCSIVNREHEVMLNGDTINAGYVYDNYCSSGYPYRQGIITLPQPESDSTYYLFHIRYNDQLVVTDLLYSRVDASGDGGLGEVVEKDVLLLQDTFADQIQAVRHGNGRDWWLVAPKSGSNIHYLFLLSPQGLEGPMEQQSGREWNDYYWSGQAIFSPDGGKYIRVNPFNGIHIYDFDRCTGELFNPLSLEFVGDTIYSGTGAGVSVSPNNRYLYVSLSTRFYQYDLWASDIGASRQFIAAYDGFLSPFPTTFFQHMLAPDGKIYITATNGVNRLHVIHNPNEPGLACNLEQHGIRLPAFHVVSAPNFPHFRLYDLPGSPCDTLGISTASEDMEQEPFSISIYPNPASSQVVVQISVALAHRAGILFQLYNGVGQLMQERSLLEEQTKIDLDGLPPGAYFWKVKSANNLSIDQGKLIVY